jgi:hypothetical protein
VKIDNEIKNSSQKSTSWHNIAKWPPSATTPWTLTLASMHFFFNKLDWNQLKKKLVI